MAKNNPSESDTPSLVEALRRARHEERLSAAVWHQKRAEVARLVAAGEEEAAQRLLKEIGDLSDVVSTRKEVATTEDHLATQPTEEPRPQAPQIPKTIAKKLKSKPKAKANHSPDVSQASTREHPKTVTPQLAKVPKRAIKPRTKFRRRGPLASWGQWLGKRPPWALSLIAHAILLLALALATFATLNETPLFLTAALAEDDAWSEMPTEVVLVELDTEVELDSAEASIDLTSLVETASAEIDITMPQQLAPVSLTGDVLATNTEALFTEIGAQAKGSGESEGGKAAAAAPPGRVRFFGSEAVANRVAFVVDNSGTMQQGRIETSLMELERAVGALATHQSFYVVFFSDQAYPMFYPQPIDEMLLATPENKRKLSAWLHTVEICLGGRLLDAVEMAAAIEPQVMYILSDGDIRSPRVMSRLTEPDSWPFAIHTLGMAARNQEDAAKLAAIANANRGQFRLVNAHPAAVRRSQKRPIPYHREPGPVWGSKVQGW